jgi:hypothetical protein
LVAFGRQAAGLVALGQVSIGIFAFGQVRQEKKKKKKEKKKRELLRPHFRVFVLFLVASIRLSDPCAESIIFHFILCSLLRFNSILF